MTHEEAIKLLKQEEAIVTQRHAPGLSQHGLSIPPLVSPSRINDWSIGEFEEVLRAYEMAYEALELVSKYPDAYEKQAPKEVSDVITSDNEGVCCLCPRCKADIGDYSSHYCPNCGQRIKWEGLK